MFAFSVPPINSRELRPLMATGARNLWDSPPLHWRHVLLKTAMKSDAKTSLKNTWRLETMICRIISMFWRLLKKIKRFYNDSFSDYHPIELSYWYLTYEYVAYNKTKFPTGILLVMKDLDGKSYPLWNWVQFQVIWNSCCKKYSTLLGLCQLNIARSQKKILEAVLTFQLGCYIYLITGIDRYEIWYFMPEIKNTT